MLPCFGHLLGFLVPGRFVTLTAVAALAAGALLCPRPSAQKEQPCARSWRALAPAGCGLTRVLGTVVSVQPRAQGVLRPQTWAECGGSWFVSAGGSVLGTNNKQP